MRAPDTEDSICARLTEPWLIGRCDSPRSLDRNPSVLSCLVRCTEEAVQYFDRCMVRQVVQPKHPRLFADLPGNRIPYLVELLQEREEPNQPFCSNPAVIHETTPPTCRVHNLVPHSCGVFLF